MAATHSPYPYGPSLTDPTATGVIAFGLAGVVALLDLIVTVLVTPALEGSGTDAVYAVFTGASLASVPALLAAYVAGALWLHQARRNSELLEPGYQHARSKVWVWLGWWVPVVFLWFPYQVVRDVQLSVTRWSTPLIGWWWGMWVALTIWGRASGAVLDEAITGGASVGAAQAVCAIGTALDLAALVLWGLVIRLITSTQLRARRGEKVLLGESGR